METHRKRDSLSALHADLLGMHDGIKGGAQRIGRSAGVMHNKFSEAVPHSEVTHREAVALAHYVQEENGSTAFAEAVCEEFGGVFVPLPAADADEDDMLENYLDVIRHFGDMSREFTEARADGVIDPDEFSSFKARGRRSVRAILHLIADEEAKVREMPQKSRAAIPLEIRRA